MTTTIVKSHPDGTWTISIDGKIRGRYRGEQVLASHLAGMIEEVDRLGKKLSEKQDECQDMAHVIIEAGVIPGEDYSCRCEQCANVARGMHDAGYIRALDEWWENEKG